MSRSNAQSDRATVYTRITAEIVAAIEAGAGKWRMPWHHNGNAISRPENVGSRRRYRGVNIVALWIAAQAFGYASGIWGTYRQWQAVGAQVRKGEHGSTVVLWKQAASSADDDHDGDEESVHRRVFARAFTVFNLAQVEGYGPEPVALLPETERFAHADAFIGVEDLGSPTAPMTPTTASISTTSSCRCSLRSGMQRRTWRRSCTSAVIMPRSGLCRMASAGGRIARHWPCGCSA